jgi:hypothetical protein
VAHDAHAAHHLRHLLDLGGEVAGVAHHKLGLGHLRCAAGFGGEGGAGAVASRPWRSAPAAALCAALLAALRPELLPDANPSPYSLRGAGTNLARPPARPPAQPPPHPRAAPRPRHSAGPHLALGLDPDGNARVVVHHLGVCLVEHVGAAVHGGQAGKALRRGGGGGAGQRGQ